MIQEKGLIEYRDIGKKQMQREFTATLRISQLTYLLDTLAQTGVPIAEQVLWALDEHILTVKNEPKALAAIR